MVKLTVIGVNDTRLRENIALMARATKRTVKEETRTVFKGMIKDGLAMNPPASGPASSGRKAYEQGVRAISRDLHRMGFAPVELKGYRTIVKAFGRPIVPIRIKTVENPAFADPDGYHRTRLYHKHGRKVTRGWKGRPFYVSRKKFDVMYRRLTSNIGKLSSWLIPAADSLGVPVPRWIKRHAGSGRGTLRVTETETKITMHAVGSFPDEASEECSEMRRRIDYLKTIAANKLRRQLDHFARSGVKKAKRN